jgi:hypothetical protein
MRGVRRTVPLFITCQRPGCGCIRFVRRPSEQLTEKYCSRRCSNIVNKNVRHAAKLGLRRSIQARRQKAIARIRGLSPRQAFLVGYKAGLSSKLYQIRRHYILVKRETA